ncbi:MAG: L-rhamnose mutarotase [Clostridia bacterium]|nr:L-rhamnose mutarotase [Clostridia bacterium]
MLRFGQMIKVKPDGLAAYKKWHANPMPGVNEMIKACHLRNYSIYSRGDYLFAYFEYDGDDFDADMAKMAADPNTQAWWDVVKPLMQPLDDRAEGEFWSDMEEVYHLD